jgi:hypothetical protein
LVIVLSSACGLYRAADPGRLVVAALFLLAVFALVGSVLTLLWRILAALPVKYVWVLASLLPILAFVTLTAVSVAIGVLVVGLGVVLIGSLIGAAVAVLAPGGWRTMNRLRRSIAVGGLVLAVAGLLAGGAGACSFWLAGLGYDVHLVDLVPRHIERARQTAGEPGTPQLAGMMVGDARDLNFENGFADAIMLHGPLYHLPQREERLRAMAEACLTAIRGRGKEATRGRFGARGATRRCRSGRRGRRRGARRWERAWCWGSRSPRVWRWAVRPWRSRSAGESA